MAENAADDDSGGSLSGQDSAEKPAEASRGTPKASRRSYTAQDKLDHLQAARSMHLSYLQYATAASKEYLSLLIRIFMLPYDGVI